MEENGNANRNEKDTESTVENHILPLKETESATPIISTKTVSASATDTVAIEASPPPQTTNGNGVKMPESEELILSADDTTITSTKRRLSNDENDTSLNTEARKKTKIDYPLTEDTATGSAVNNVVADEEDVEEDELLKEISKITDDATVQNGVAKSRQTDILQEDDLLKRLSEIETPTRPKSSTAVTPPNESDDLIERLEASASDEAVLEPEEVTKNGAVAEPPVISEDDLMKDLTDEPVKADIVVDEKKEESQMVDVAETKADEPTPENEDVLLSAEETKEDEIADKKSIPIAEKQKTDAAEPVAIPEKTIDDDLTEVSEESILDTTDAPITDVEEESIEDISAEIENASHTADVLLAIPTQEEKSDVKAAAEESEQSIEETLEEMEGMESVPELVVDGGNSATEQQTETDVTDVQVTETTTELVDSSTAKPAVQDENIDDLTSVLEGAEEAEPSKVEEVAVEEAMPTQSVTKEKSIVEATTEAAEVAKSSDSEIEGSPMESLTVSMETDTEIADVSINEPECTSSTVAEVEAEPKKADVAKLEPEEITSTDVELAAREEKAKTKTIPETSFNDRKQISAVVSEKPEQTREESSEPAQTEKNHVTTASTAKKTEATVEEKANDETDALKILPTIPEEVEEKPTTIVDVSNEAAVADTEVSPATVETKPEKSVLPSEADTEPMEIDDDQVACDSMNDLNADSKNDKTFDECSSTTQNDESLKITPKISTEELREKIKDRLAMMTDSSSTTGTPNNVSTSNPSVFNSTPFVAKQKPFAMSSENVSKINESSEIENSSAQDTHDEEMEEQNVNSNSVASTVESHIISNSDTDMAKTTDFSEAEGTTATESDSAVDSKELNTVTKCTSSSSTSSGTCSRFIDTCRQINGIDSTIDDIEPSPVAHNETLTTNASITETPSLPNLSQLQIKPTKPLHYIQNGLEPPTSVISPNETLSTLTADTSEIPSYEISVWYEEQNIKTFSIEKIDVHTVHSLTTDSGSSRNYSSSNGSVNSFGPFALPGPRSNVSSSHSSSTSSIDNFAVPTLPGRMKHVVKGTLALYDYMIEYFTKCRATLEESGGADSSMASTIKLSDVSPKKRLSNDFSSPAEKGRKSASKKRSLSPNKLDNEDEEKSKAKQVKKSPAQPSTPTITVVPDDLDPEDLEKIGQCCLARWTDRKYYAGRIEQVRPSDKKIVVKFEDGACKALNPDLVIVGREDFLPLMDHSVHALTEDDTHEPGLVTGMFRDDRDDVMYTVLMASGEVMVQPSNLYLTDEQAKLIQNAQKKAIAESRGETETTDMLSPAAAGRGRPPGRRNLKKDLSMDLSSPAELSSKGRSLRNRRATDKAVSESPEAGYSGGVHTEGKRGRRPNKRAIQPSRSESSDISETYDDSAPNSPESGLEAIDGVQPELQKGPKESELIKMNVIAEYLGNDKNKSLDDIIGPIPSSKALFRNKHFILTCTIPIKGSNDVTPTSEDPEKEEPDDSMTNRLKKFATLPFVKEHLKNQIEAGGGKVYQHFEDIPKNKYKQCKLIAPHPCVTAKFVQCLAVDIPAISHEWIIECCQKLTVLDTKPYLLPSGWSILENRYIKWAVGRGAEQRSSANPFFNNSVLLASQNKEFTEFWSRVCKFAGATIRFIKSESDITSNLSGYMLTDQEFPDDIKLEAQRKGLPVVSSVWAVQSLILGKICLPTAHEKLTQTYQDDDF